MIPERPVMIKPGDLVHYIHGWGWCVGDLPPRRLTRVAWGRCLVIAVLERDLVLLSAGGTLFKAPDHLVELPWHPRRA